jgi:hypothetical protein
MKRKGGEMPESALLDLTATDVTEQSWEDLVRSMGYDPDSDPVDPPSYCGSSCCV